jgi:uncharacterized protein YggE
MIVPDEVVIYLTVASQKKRILDAKSACDRVTKAVLALAKVHNIAPENFKITNLDLSPRYNRQKELIGYCFQRSLRIRLRDFSKIDPLLSDLVEAGVDHVGGMTFRTSDQTRLQVEARRLAVEYAKVKASHLAELNGLRLGDAISIEEDVERGWNVGGMASMIGQVPDAKSNPVATAMPASPDVLGTRRGFPGIAAVSFQQKRDSSDKDARTNARADNRNGLLAPGQIKLNATVTIVFELLRK